MATASFTKDFTLEDSESIESFVNIVSDTETIYPINGDLASDESMERGRKLLKQYLSL